MTDIDNTSEPRTDFVLVISKDRIINLVTYVHNLESLGLLFQLSEGIKDPELIFLRISIPPHAIQHFSKLYGIGVEHRKYFHIDSRVQFKLFAKPQIPEYVSKKDGEATNCEKSYLIHMILQSTKFGPEESQYGLAKLMRIDMIKAAFPIHDGPYNYEPDQEVLNDRQLLGKYWATINVMFKEQPLDLIEKYYGTEVAFYFAWAGYFNYMLLLPTIGGIACFVISLMVLNSGGIHTVDEICNNHQPLCAVCINKDYCHFLDVSHNCPYARWEYLFDNYLTIIFTTFTLFWSKFFLIVWTRIEYKLKLRWNVEFEDLDTELRSEYKDKTQSQKLSLITGKLEPQVPKKVQLYRFTVTISVILFLILIVAVAIICVIAYKIFMLDMLHASHNPSIKSRAKLLSTLSGCTLQVIFIKIFGHYYKTISIWLTDHECPRTESEYEKSVLYKNFILQFVNIFLPFFYIAFIKGRFYSSPDKQGNLNMIRRDICPLNCIVYLNTQLVILMIGKKLLGNLIVFIKPLVKKLCNLLKTEPEEEVLPAWEAEYHLTSINKYQTTTEFSEMAVEYGCVTFFIAAFPLAPLCALLNNILELRLDAYKFANRFRRPIPRRNSGIGAWNGILLGMTYMATATNAFIIAFTGDFVSKELYRYKVHQSSYKGFNNYSLSSFATKDYPLFKQVENAPEICFYRDKRYPHDHPSKYQRTTDYWFDLTWRFVFVLLFEHFILISTGIITNIIPNIPTTVKTQLNMDRQKAKAAKIAILNKEKHKPANVASSIVRYRTLAKPQVRGPIVA